jgi:tRNA-2-methylthio-N6-dimethylallyladenosine synthase
VARKFYVRAFGCQMNEHDAERVAALLAAEGLERTERVEDADVVVLETCCVRQRAEERLYGELGHLKALAAKRPGVQIAVGGCLAQKDREHLRERAPHVAVVYGTRNVDRVPVLLRRAAEEGPVVEVPEHLERDPTVLEVPMIAAPRKGSRASAWVTIQAGCDNTCTFCIVPIVRGKQVSKPFDRVIEEVRALAANGVSEVVLLGQNVNSYGRDLTGRRPLFAELLRAVGSVEGIRRVRFTSPHPKDLRSDTIAAMAETDTVCEQLHLPLQSGSDRVLAAMHRGYTAERYLERLAEARAAIPDLAVTTDVIVGFPGETEDDFARTLEVVAEAGFDSAYTFLFSPRPGTAAARMEDRFVDPEVAASRFERLRAVVERSALLRHRARIGLVEEVLVEGRARRHPTSASGRTRQGKLVHFALPAGEDPGAWVGRYVRVRVRDAGPHHLDGELVADPDGQGSSHAAEEAAAGPAALASSLAACT